MANSTIERSTSFWGDAALLASTGLSNTVRQYDWHYIVYLESPQPASADWLMRLVARINRPELFPHCRRYTSEPPGVLPIRYSDASGKAMLAIIIAVPPGALRASLSAYETARPVFEDAVADTFVAPALKVRLATSIQIGSLLEGTDQSSIEFTTEFVRDHHETWDSSAWTPLEKV